MEFHIFHLPSDAHLSNVFTTAMHLGLLIKLSNNIFIDMLYRIADKLNFNY